MGFRRRQEQPAPLTPVGPAAGGPAAPSVAPAAVQVAPAAVQVGPAPPSIAPAAVQVITDATFMDATEGGWTVVDFWAAWCGPCKSFAPVFAAVASAHDGPVRFGACDVDANPATAQLLGIRSIPTLVVFGPDGSEVGRSTGLVSRGDLEATVRQLAER